MSRATEIIMAVDAADARHVEDLSFWLARRAPRTDDRTTEPAGHLLPLTGAAAADWGGNLRPASTIWTGVTNHLDLPVFLDRIERTLWESTDRVQLLARDDGDPWFRIYMIRDDQLRQYAPTPASDETDRPW